MTTSIGNYVFNRGNVVRINSWLQGNQNDFNDLRFGYCSNMQLNLFDQKFTRKLTVELNANGSIISQEEEALTLIFSEDETPISTSYSKTNNTYGVLTNKGKIYSYKKKSLEPIVHNYASPLTSATSILTDLNGDFWISSQLKGIYKVSNEAFTKLQLNPVFLLPNIKFSHRTIYGDIILSTMDGKTYSSNTNYNTEFKEFNLKVVGMGALGGDIIAGTDKGVFKFVSGENQELTPILFEGKNITLLYSEAEKTWIHVHGEGLYLVSKNYETRLIQPSVGSAPEFIYSASSTMDGNTIYFGSNNGIFSYSKQTDNIKSINIPNGLGGYAGNTTRDKYGTCWFTLNNGLLGIDHKGKIKIIKDRKYFSSFLFYTFSSDEFGNLIIGSNKGIDLLKIDREGTVLRHRNFDKNSGVDGYETHMRSEFTIDGISYVGTVEGLFSINTSIIENAGVPIAPTITLISNSFDDLEHTSSDFNFKFHVNNSKIEVKAFRYRIGSEEEWKTIIARKTISLKHLSDGKYSLEVCASYDGVTFGPISEISFIVDLPIWKSNWFIILMLLGIVLVNVFLVSQNKSFNESRLIDTKDLFINIKMTPTILLFAALSVTSSHIAGPLLSDDLELHLGLTMAIGFILLLLFFFALQTRKTGAEKQNQIYLISALCLVTLHFYYEIYLSNLHPFHIIGVVLTSMVAPYILNRVRHTVFFALGLLFLSAICVAVLNDTVYPKVHFLIANVVLVFLLIISSYLRFDSLEKLVFISGIINRGDFPAIAFDKSGRITYVSENISRFVGADHNQLLHQNISLLNKFVPYEGAFKEADITSEFKDGENYLVPMKNTSGVIHWMEWSYKNFSKDIKIVLGHDVSEKMELENTYELLVQNAEDFIYRADVDGNFIFMNDICYEKLGYGKDELLGESSLTIVDDDYKKEIKTYNKNHFEKELGSSFKEFPILKKNGEKTWVGQYMTTLYNPGSNVPSGFIALARDITERKEKEQIIQTQRENITSSINYARRIQLKLLPHERKFQSYLEDFFIFYQPKDIVSGDFYWYEKIEKEHVLILADCTGHGVPGSFMTLLGANILNSTIVDHKHRDPGMILNILNDKLIETLSKSEGSELADGMEVVICVFDDDSNQLSYACAGGRFLIHQKGEFTLHKGDLQHIGDDKPEGFKGYRTQLTEFTPDDQLILFTDGFQDQFGGQEDKKFRFRNLIELFEKNIDLEMTEQGQNVKKAFQDWKGIREQTDDVTIVSIKKHKC
jgi:PAS domain S-box-containing protein